MRRHQRLCVVMYACLSCVALLRVALLAAGAELGATRVMTLVDFGESGDATALAPNWTEVFHGAAMAYMSANGHDGLALTTAGANTFDNYQGVSAAAPLQFEAGDQILVTWYNNTGARIRSWSPLISFEDADAPDATPGQPQWFMMKEITGNPEKQYVIDYFENNTERKSFYTITSADSAPGVAAPTEGRRARINISANHASPGLICDKIVYVPRELAAPSPVVGVTAVPNAERPDSRVNLSWDAARVHPDIDTFHLSYRVYRNRRFLRATTGTSFIDSNLEHSTRYDYTVQAYNMDTPGEPSDSVSVMTASFQGGSRLIDPQTDLTYLGAFRAPNPSLLWQSQSGDIAYYPHRAATGPQYWPGSLYMHGHLWRAKNMVAEITIPIPTIPVGDSLEEQYASLPEADALTEFTTIHAAEITEEDVHSEAYGHRGLAYVPSRDRFYFTFYDNYNQSGRKRKTHGSFTPDFRDLRGLWWVGDRNATFPHYDAYAMALSPVPKAWADAHAPGYELIGTGTRSKRSQHGPGIVAVKPWDDEGNPPPYDAELACKVFVHYSVGSDEFEMAGYVGSDLWTGIEWLATADTSAVALHGTKRFGYNYYGFSDGTLNEDKNNAVPKLKLPLEYGGKGNQSSDSAGMLLFYDPEDFVEVLEGRMAAGEPQPYAALETARFALGGDPGSVTFDAARGVMYVLEANVLRGASVIHAFKVGK